MKAWHVQDNEGDMQEIVFADRRIDAIYKSEAMECTKYIDIRIKRAKYADNLENEPSKLIQAQLDNGWIFECSKCSNYISEDDKYIIKDNSICCEKCNKEQ
ncbi:MAG: hypothetical protein K0R54_729 [Clostridiaceae bacterium]|jgi:hypothetical protein|nr:hypothetical protein [Clostridiaceae bacterium]